MYECLFYCQESELVNAARLIFSLVAAHESLQDVKAKEKAASFGAQVESLLATGVEVHKVKQKLS